MHSVRTRTTRTALALLVATTGCDAIFSGSRYIEGEVVPATARPVATDGDWGVGDADPKVSPDGRSVAFSQHGAVWIVDVATGILRRVTSGRNVDWSPDGLRLAFGDGASIYTARADGSERVVLAGLGRSFFPDWSPDGRQLAFDRSLPDALGPAGVWVVNADGSTPRPVCGAAFPDWERDGRALLALQGRPDPEESFEFVRCDVATGAETPLPIRGLFDHSHARLSPDGSRVVYETTSGVWVGAADGAWARQILPNDLADRDADGRRVAAASPSWHPDGVRIVYEHLRIDSYAESPYGPVIRGEATIRLLDVDVALRASEL